MQLSEMTGAGRVNKFKMKANANQFSAKVFVREKSRKTTKIMPETLLKFNTV